MAINKKIIDDKPWYDIDSEVAKYQHYHQVKLININILHAKKYYYLPKFK